MPYLQISYEHNNLTLMHTHLSAQQLKESFLGYLREEFPGKEFEEEITLLGGLSRIEDTSVLSESPVSLELICDTTPINAAESVGYSSGHRLRVYNEERGPQKTVVNDVLAGYAAKVSAKEGVLQYVLTAADAAKLRGQKIAMDRELERLNAPLREEAEKSLQEELARVRKSKEPRWKGLLARIFG